MLASWASSPPRDQCLPTLVVAQVEFEGRKRISARRGNGVHLLERGRDVRGFVVVGGGQNAKHTQVGDDTLAEEVIPMLGSSCKL